MHNKQVRRRRALLAALVGVSLILLTAYFGESPNSPLHTVQRGIVEVLSPVQEGASKVLKPVRDIAGWFSSTLHAKSQRDQLRKQVASLLKQVDQLRVAQIENSQLSREVGLDQSIGISAYRAVGAHVIWRDPTLWYATVEVDKGAVDGVHRDDPVVGDGALVGKVSTVGANFAIVTLITDHSFAVAARVLDQNGDTGVLVPAVGNPKQLLLQYLQKPADLQTGPQPGQQVVTAGFKSGPLDSLYPAGIPIGSVSNANENVLLNSGQVQVAPAADLPHLDSVQILTSPQAGNQRAQLP
ncbi:MAG: rod shape-determining protein MreC [Solirubrobacterales bacterium]|nr:rod shape-determining protein MreC [Solirubrobacterales bacterium]MBV9839650.1 rod shape-determining protein MreC [Solirubrobacterales bacterium]